jgi:hypothetical protein
MKLILKICLAALLVAFLSSPLIARTKQQSGGTTPPAKSEKASTAAPSPIPVPYPNAASPKTKTGNRVPPAAVKEKSIGSGTD